MGPSSLRRESGLSRRAVLAVLLGGVAGSVVGCAQGDHPNLIALRQDAMATWIPKDVTNERRDEENPTSGFVGATSYAVLSRIFTIRTQTAATQGMAAARAAALANGWRVREDQGGRITKILPIGVEAELIISDYPLGKEWAITLNA